MKKIIEQAHSQILEIFKKMLPKEMPYSQTSSKEFNEARGCYNQALQDIRAKIEELKG